jgi:hypothetical protein
MDEGGAVAGGAGISDIEIGMFMAVDSRVEDRSLWVEGALILSRDSVCGNCWGVSTAVLSARGGKILLSPSRGSKRTGEGEESRLLLAADAPEACSHTNGLDRMVAVDDPAITGEAARTAKVVAFGSLDT